MKGIALADFLRLCFRLVKCYDLVSCFFKNLEPKISFQPRWLCLTSHETQICNFQTWIRLIKAPTKGTYFMSFGDLQKRGNKKTQQRKNTLQFNKDSVFVGWFHTFFVSDRGLIQPKPQPKLQLGCRSRSSTRDTRRLKRVFWVGKLESLL